jgi:hypothetical protein
MKLKLVIALGAAACMAAPVQAAAPARNAAAKAAAAEIPPPPPGMGQVVFYRSSKMGMLISCKVHENGQAVSSLPPGKYFVHAAAPGVHEFTVKSEAKDTLRLEVEEGETQYARCAIGMGIGVGRPNLSLQSREDFEKRGKKLKLYKSKKNKD